MTALEFARKVTQRCKRCGVELGDDHETLLCTPHQLDLNARVRASRPTTRAGRRARAAARHARLLPLSIAAA